ncbi:MAG: radical SAM protein [Nanoarchaeota archaeon]
MSITRKLRTSGKIIAALTEIGIVAESEKWNIRFDFYRTFTPGIPLLQWFFTKACNYSCQYCNVGSVKTKDLGQDERIEGLDFLIKKFHPKILSISGGEPTLYLDDLAAFINHGKRQHVFVGLNTNGSRLTETSIDALADAGLDYISFSYDALPPKDDEQVFELAQYAVGSGMISAIQPVFSKKNWERRGTIMEKARMHGALFNPSIVMSSGLAYSTTNEEQPPKEEVQAFFAELPRGYFSGVKNSERYIQYMKNNFGTPWTCRNFSWISVSHDGTLRHCNEYVSQFTIHDLADKKKWKQFERYRQETSQQCSGCYYQCFFDAEKGGLWSMHFKDFLNIERLARMKHFSRSLKRTEQIISKYFPESESMAKEKSVE